MNLVQGLPLLGRLVIVRAPGRQVSKESLDAHCLDRIARFKRPKHYIFLDALPKNSYGKVLKRELRQTLAISNSASSRST